MKQGTAFFLKDVGIVTCDHCIRDDDSTEILTDLIIYARHDLNKKYNLKLIKTHKDIDIAIFEVPENITESGLEVGSSRELNQLHSIAVAGFPNYNFGDSGTIGTGSITGFRNHLGLRHLLISCPLISGNSGGPALNNDSKVIGIAVTGADKMSKAHETEKHMLIPIESLSLLGFKI